MFWKTVLAMFVWYTLTTVAVMADVTRSETESDSDAQLVEQLRSGRAAHHPRFPRAATDHDFHAIAMPQVGPGKGDGPDGRDDFGRERVTERAADRYRFRTPTLRNVALTGPWGHDGAYATLEVVIRHHLDPVTSLDSYDSNQLVVPQRDDLDEHDFVVQSDPARWNLIAAACELPPSPMNERTISYLN